MSADRKGPLAAFIVVAIIAAILLITSVRSQAATGWLGRALPTGGQVVHAVDGGLDLAVTQGRVLVHRSTAGPPPARGAWSAPSLAPSPSTPASTTVSPDPAISTVPGTAAVPTHHAVRAHARSIRPSAHRSSQPSAHPSASGHAASSHGRHLGWAHASRSHARTDHGRHVGPAGTHRR